MKKINYAVILIILCGTLLSAQSKFGVGVSGVFISPTGDFGDLYKSGIGGLASLTYNVTDNIQLSASAGYSALSFNNDKFNELLNDMGITTKVEIDSDIKIIPLLLGGRYYITKTDFRPYAALDLGLHIVSVSAASVTVAGQTLNAVKEESKAATAWGIGIGFLLKVAPKINIDVNAKINGNSLESSTDLSVSSPGYSYSQSSKSTTTFFSIAAGVLIEL